MWRSSIGGKVTMAVTGILLFGFVIAHLLGNLTLLAGPEAIAEYAKFLHGKPALIWAARAGLLAIFALHVLTGIRLSRANRNARPIPYAVPATVQATFASRSMLLSGLTLLVFVVYHLLHFTVGAVHAEDVALRANGYDGYDVYAMVTASFARPAVVIAYLIGQLVLFLHLSHGVQSFAQTLGLSHPRYRRRVRATSFWIALLVAGGNSLLVLSVMLGIAGGK
jgi:succinate dehydrogenase / fumarate reductase cytochrome b subunit